MREAPPFARITERLDRLEGRLVVDEPDLGLPGELDDRVPPDGDALAEVLRVERLVLEDFAGLELDLADPRLTVLSGALVEVAVDILQALGEGLPVVGIDLDDAIASHRCRRFLLRGARRVRHGCHRRTGREERQRRERQHHRRVRADANGHS